MAFSAAEVKNLREMTGVGMMDCKKALTAADGDIDKAVEWLREKGLAAAQKKAGRIAAEGMAYAAVVDGIGVIVEVNAESDFVAKNDLFVDYVKGVAAVRQRDLVDRFGGDNGDRRRRISAGCRGGSLPSHRARWSSHGAGPRRYRRQAPSSAARRGCPTG